MQQRERVYKVKKDWKKGESLVGQKGTIIHLMDNELRIHSRMEVSEIMVYLTVRIITAFQRAMHAIRYDARKNLSLNASA